MLLKNFFTFSILLLSVSVTVGQRKCYTDEYHKHPAKQAELKKFEQMVQAYSSVKRGKDDNEILSIPVVVHVVYHSKLPVGNVKSDNISDEQIVEQIRVLNEDFRRKPNTNGFNSNPIGADAGMEFCLATKDPNGNPTNGITRTYHARSEWDAEDDNEALKSVINWPSNQYLNIWVTNIANSYLGYAQFPSGSNLVGLNDGELSAETDGVVIDFTAFGTGGSNKPPYDIGRTTTHEVGHWLGLRHIWGDSYCGTDYVNDTPVQENENLFNEDCEAQISYCTGDSTIDMIENYMDYSPDKCMNIFTKGQVERMRACFMAAPRRKDLLNSFGCCSDGQLVNLPFREDFESGDLTENQWKIKNLNSGKTWETIGVGGFGESWSSISIANEGTYTSTDTNYVDYLESPFISFINSFSPKMNFNLAYAKNNSTLTDSLVITYNLTCKDDWKHLVTFDGKDLITTDKTASGFIPAAKDWKQIKLDLSLLKGKNVKFRFESYSKAKNNTYIDDINIFNAYTSMQVSLSSPSDKKLNVDMQYENEKEVEISIYNMLGQPVSNFKEANRSSHATEIDISHLNSGIYVIIVATNNDKISKKFLVP